MVDRPVALAAALVIAGERGDALEQRRLPVPFSPTMMVMARSKERSSPWRRNGRQKG